jgi:hypothetical protein
MNEEAIHRVRVRSATKKEEEEKANKITREIFKHTNEPFKAYPV